MFFRPLRKYVLIAGILMHGYVEYSMNIPLFSYLMVSTYICFYDGEEISAWSHPSRPAPKALPSEQSNCPPAQP